MRWTIPYAFALASLIGCYNPNYGSKPCTDRAGCPTGYFCDTTRPSGGAAGTCTAGDGPSGGMDASTPIMDLAAADLAPPLGLREYFVQGGSFTIGTTLTDLSGSNDSPAFQRSVGNFCAQENEVTVAAYTLCVQAGKCSVPAGTGVDCNYGASGKEKHPINCVELPQARAFCTWINRRLPTEGEWEYAANGPTASAGAKYPWAGGGGTFDATKACFNTGNGTCAVGTKARTYLGKEVLAGSPGFYDLAGNVFEWTESEPCSYSFMVPDGTCSSAGRVVRGGSAFDNDSRVLRSTVRLANAKDGSSINGTFTNSWYKNTGFRCFSNATSSGTCVP